MGDPAMNEPLISDGGKYQVFAEKILGGGGVLIWIYHGSTMIFPCHDIMVYDS